MAGGEQEGALRAPESQEEVFGLAAGHGGTTPLSDSSKGQPAFPGLGLAALGCSWATWAQEHLGFQLETAVQNRSPKWDSRLHLDKTPAKTSLSGALRPVGRPRAGPGDVADTLTHFGALLGGSGEGGQRSHPTCSPQMHSSQTRPCLHRRSAGRLRQCRGQWLTAGSTPRPGLQVSEH